MSIVDNGFTKLYSEILFPYKYTIKVTGKKSFSMIMRLEMILTVVSHEKKNIILLLKNVILTKNNTFNNVICNRIFPCH